ncbi:uncharacterized protein LOC132391500 isoform X3 [Hypanus sabinus]|uniref:uncharacterized protein LOC132391500 isoform X3 n=1 Tax=Hypanus sabinus TaxID=79690 RepID=UPI0028C4E515|nr:uncharacterized protein LOC132391500 isoform X3 [Hypanus sabinus]
MNILKCFMLPQDGMGQVGWHGIEGLRPEEPLPATWWTLFPRPKPRSEDGICQVISLFRCYNPSIAYPVIVGCFFAIFFICLTWFIHGKRMWSSAPLSADRSKRPHFQCGKEEDLGRSGKKISIS